MPTARLPIRPVMLRLLVLAAALLALAPAPTAQARDILGLGDQQPATFDDPAFEWLKIKTARLVIPWDVQNIPHERERTRLWLREARKDRVQPVIAFGRAWSRRGHRILPSGKQYRRAFRRFRRAYPRVRVFIAWNEGNHPKQPTWRHPRAAARYFNTIRRECRKCTVVAGEVVDTPGMTRWLERYKAALRFRPQVWGLHNYKDAFERRFATTRQFLKITRGKVWLTETGGVVRRPKGRTGVSRKRRLSDAAKATSYVLRLARAQRRITRVYLYQWRGSPASPWDSALIDANGRFRPAFRVAARFLGRNLRRAPRRIRLRGRPARRG